MYNGWVDYLIFKWKKPKFESIYTFLSIFFEQRPTG